MYFKIFLLLIVYFGFSWSLEIRPQITTPLGVIRGTYFNSTLGKTYEAFEGIPFAKAPLKKYRFREPRPIGKWNGVLEARYLYTCLQYNHLTRSIIGEEDCLYINVYTPDHKTLNLFDVIIFIHGGAFMFGSGHSYKERIIMNRDVVFVTFNYRLGPFGFLSTEDSIVPGNMGMKDQVAALKWIQNNIIHFGGNPQSITLSGMSAGGASVNLHLISPLSKGLFHRGFSQSGTALNPWVMQEAALEKTKQLAAKINCDYKTIKETIDCLNYAPASHIMEAVQNMFVFLYNPFSPFGVVVEPPGTVNSFLPAQPYEMINTNQIQDLPWLVSHVQFEGLYPGAEFYPDNYLDEIDKRWTELAPHILQFNYTNPDKDHSALTMQIKERYLSNKPISKETFLNLIQMISDRLFVTHSQMAAKLQAHINSSPVYYYYFTYRGAHSKSEVLTKTNDIFGAAHGDDTVYVLNSSVDVGTTKNDRDMSEALLDLWTSFAASGVPKYLNASWKPISKNIKDPLNYIEIKSVSPSLIETHSRDFDNVDYWFNLPLKENQHLSSIKNDEL